MPSYDASVVAVPAPAPGPGNWTGAASAVLVDGTFWLAYRVRRPLTDGRGVRTVIARLPDGRTRFYVEAARPDGAHDLVTCVR